MEQPKDYAVEDDIYLTKNQKFLLLCFVIFIAGCCFIGGYLGAAKFEADAQIEQAKLLSNFAAKEWAWKFGPGDRGR